MEDLQGERKLKQGPVTQPPNYPPEILLVKRFRSHLQNVFCLDQSGFWFSDKTPLGPVSYSKIAHATARPRYMEVDARLLYASLV